MLLFAAIPYAISLRAFMKYKDCPPGCDHKLEYHLFLRGIYRIPRKDYFIEEKIITFSNSVLREGDDVVLLMNRCGKTWRENLYIKDNRTCILMSPKEKIVSKILAS